ncbi:MAG: aminotransferase class V-fold PLP-dependent enzyme, partial [Flavobacteriales bacterium]
IDNFCHTLAALFNTEATQLCPQSNLSSALTKILYSLRPSDQRHTILLSEEDFPSLGFVVQRAQTMGYKIKFIPAEMDLQDMQVWKKHIDEEVLFVLLTQVQSNNGRLLPIQEILEISRSKGCISILDVAQSAGLVPMDLQVLDADFVIGSCVKWLCGGPGAGFLWASNDMLNRCEPIDVGWFSHIDPFEFNIHDFRFAGDAKKFWGGTPSVAAFILAGNSIKQILEIGIEEVRIHNLEYTQLVINAWGEKVVSPHEAKLRSGTLIVDFGDDQQTFIGNLNQTNVQFDSRIKGVRLSPHIYNKLDEIDLLLSCAP